MAILCTDLTQRCFNVYIGAFFSLLLSIVFCGWGTTTPYKYNPIFYFFGIVGASWVLLMLLRSYNIHKVLEAEEEDKLKGHNDESIRALAKSDDSIYYNKLVNPM